MGSYTLSLWLLEQVKTVVTIFWRGLDYPASTPAQLAATRSIPRLLPGSHFAATPPHLQHLVMVATRSARATPAKRSLEQSFQPSKPSRVLKQTPVANAAQDARSPSGSPAKRKKATVTVSQEAPLPLLTAEEVQLCTTAAMPNLPFDLTHGKSHLVRADPRFKPLLERIPLRVFEELDSEAKDLDLFKTLVTSIMGQQVSWLAARAILYKFIRLFFSDLPPTPDFTARPRESLPFPTPLQVQACSDERLKSAGLSGQKVRYVSDIAQRFSDGRLDVRKILAMGEEEVIEELCKIKGVGVWTAQMLLIFALRRPDVWPVGDLGVQRGAVLLWASGPEGPQIKSAKARPPEDKVEVVLVPSSPDGQASLHQKNEATDALKVEAAVEGAEHAAMAEQTQPVPLRDQHDHEPSEKSIPSIPAESGLTASTLNARKNGTKTKGNVYLNAAEMDALAKEWRPYRSLAAVLMWALVDA